MVIRLAVSVRNAHQHNFMEFCSGLPRQQIRSIATSMVSTLFEHFYVISDGAG
jgi:hypothetical protein